ncbi:MAG: response regulator transcription factor [Actinomycetota bacterium]|nr:response regulator transcription factor [Actinomycetota bacterium]
MLRMVLVDDHAVVRSGLRALLELENGWRVVGEASGSSDAVDVVGRFEPDVALVDLQLDRGRPGGPPGTRQGGLELLSRLRALHPSLGLVVLTTFLDSELLFDALRRGADGYVVKEVDISELVRVVRSVAAGETALDLRSAALAARTLTHGGGKGTPAQLSVREREIAALVAQGMTNREIAVKSFCSESTVKFHLRNVMQKLGVHTRSAVAAETVRLG